VRLGARWSDRGAAYIEVAALPGKKLRDAKYPKGTAVRRGKSEEKSEEKSTGLKTRHYKREKRKDAGLKPRRYIFEGLGETGTIEVDGTIEEAGFRKPTLLTLVGNSKELWEIVRTGR
jgi:hypothetical protein